MPPTQRQGSANTSTEASRYAPVLFALYLTSWVEEVLNGRRRHCIAGAVIGSITHLGQSPHLAPLQGRAVLTFNVADLLLRIRWLIELAPSEIGDDSLTIGGL